ncbi:hypothetical protein, partial [uncultured Dietzia sp.]|uniref:hypothetical protein n=1 Tax=uncultured Dietzia sp. TaxID=395519 RepID=UPI0026068D56
ENLGAVRTMQAFGAERATSARFASAAEEAYDAARSATTARWRAASTTPVCSCGAPRVPTIATCCRSPHPST